MKRDCGGAAAILGAFSATIKQVSFWMNPPAAATSDSLQKSRLNPTLLCLLKGFKDNLHAVFCLAENAVGPTATRPDDIHTLYSGK